MKQKYLIVTFDTPLTPTDDKTPIWGYRQPMVKRKDIETDIEEYVEYIVANDFNVKFNDKWGINQDFVPENRTLYTNLEKTQFILFHEEEINTYTTNDTRFNCYIFRNYPINYQVYLNKEIPEDLEWLKNEHDYFITSEENRNKFKQLFT